MKIKGKIKHLQQLKLNIFPVKIKHSLDKKFSKIDEKIEKSFCNILRKFGFRAVQRVLNLVDLKKMLKNDYLDAKIGVDTEENEPSKVL